MFKSSNKIMAKVTLAVLTIQLLLVGLGGGATGVYAGGPGIPGEVYVSPFNLVTPVTNYNKPRVVSFTSVAGTTLPSTVNVTLDAIDYVATIADTFCNATTCNFSWRVQPGIALKDGAYNVSAIYLDSNNVVLGSESLTNAFIVDTTNPVVTVDQQTTNNLSPTISGTIVESNPSTLVVKVGGYTYSVLPAGNVWSVDVTALLPEGVYDVVATATDLAGNVGIDKTVGELTITTNPILKLTQSIPSITSSNTPTFKFSSTEAGTINFLGGCTSATSAALVGENTVVLEKLADGTYSNCSITVTSTTNKTSDMLSLGSFTVDASAPVVTMTSKPVIVNDVKKTIEVTFTGNEAIKLASANVTFTQGAVVGTFATEAQIDPKVLTVIVPADTFVAGTTPIDVAAKFADLAGNITDYAGQINVDTVAPAAVTGLTTLVDAAGHVTIGWVNPAVGTYTTLRVVRVGDFTVVLDPSATNYVDLTTVAGKTYQYVIVVGDAAGNEATTLQISVTVPVAQVAAAVSDTASYSAPTTTTPSEVKAQEVKGDSSQPIEKTAEKSGFPVWGIILLIVLAVIGGYLIWNQKPVVQPVPTVVAKKKATTKKKK